MKKRQPNQRRRSEHAPPLRRVTAPAPPASDDAAKVAKSDAPAEAATPAPPATEEKTEEDNKPRVMPLRPPILSSGCADTSARRCAENSIARSAAGAAAAVGAASSACAGASNTASAAADSNYYSGCASSGPGSFGSASAIAASGRTSRNTARSWYSAPRSASRCSSRSAASRRPPRYTNRACAARSDIAGAAFGKGSRPARCHSARPSVTLAGQPAARPIVPPRPDLAARLGQQQPRSPMPGQAPPPRPGVPLRPQTPRPGQPLYQGPPRPGSAPMGRPDPAPHSAGAAPRWSAADASHFAWRPARSRRAASAARSGRAHVRNITSRTVVAEGAIASASRKSATSGCRRAANSPRRRRSIATSRFPKASR